jgi:hypothetical protein
MWIISENGKGKEESECAITDERVERMVHNWKSHSYLEN